MLGRYGGFSSPATPRLLSSARFTSGYDLRLHDRDLISVGAYGPSLSHVCSRYVISELLALDLSPMRYYPRQYDSTASEPAPDIIYLFTNTSCGICKLSKPKP